MENLRQRTKREVEQAKLFGHQAFAKDIISIADVLEMALGSVKKLPEVKVGASEAAHTPTVSENSTGGHLKDMIEGLSMTLGEMHKVFAKHGITPIDPLHQKFDPNMHTALFEVQDSKVEPGTVVNVQKKGYTLHQRLLRSASVGVSKH